MSPILCLGARRRAPGQLAVAIKALDGDAVTAIITRIEAAHAAPTEVASAKTALADVVYKSALLAKLTRSWTPRWPPRARATRRLAGWWLTRIADTY